MTWAQTSVGRTVTRTGLFLKKQLWIWPIIAVVILSVVGLWVRHAIESTMKENLRSELQTLLAAETAMLEKWFEVQSSNAESAANNLPFREAVYRLLEEAGGTEPVAAADSQADTGCADIVAIEIKNPIIDENSHGVFVGHVRVHMDLIIRITTQ